MSISYKIKRSKSLELVSIKVTFYCIVYFSIYALYLKFADFISRSMLTLRL